MSEPYIGEIRMFAGNFAIYGWAFCNGQIMSIVENETLFNLIGTTYGGDGVNTFALPDLRSRVPIHLGQSAGTSSYSIGETGGVEQVTLTMSQIPSHSHPLTGSTNTATSRTPTGNVHAVSTHDVYANGPASATMNAGAVGAVGGSQPHDNRQPFLAINFIIALFGIYPSQL